MILCDIGKYGKLYNKLTTSKEMPFRKGGNSYPSGNTGWDNGALV